MEQLLRENDLILMEGAVVERLRRSPDINLHPLLENAPLIYDKSGRAALTEIYTRYIAIAEEANIPFFLFTPTWRANRQRVKDSQISSEINSDAVRFMKEIRATHSHEKHIKIGGLMGCRNDSYKPEEGLSVPKAESFHAWQIEQLAEGGADFLIAETLPNVNEALGIARAMGKSHIPYFISFVISRDGKVLDGTSLWEAIRRVDNGTTIPPAGYAVNCAYPTFLCANEQPKEIFTRLIAYQANASSLDHCELDGSGSLEVNNIAEWGRAMLELKQSYGIKILGGCCGTSEEHLRFITSR